MTKVFTFRACCFLAGCSFPLVDFLIGLLVLLALMVRYQQYPTGPEFLPRSSASRS